MFPNNYFEDCHKCVPPERHPGCHATCPRYAEGKAKYDADKAKQHEREVLKTYVNNKVNESADNVAKYAKRRPRRYKQK